MAIIAATAGLTLAIMRTSFASADEDEEKPITSSVAQISRDAAGNVLITIQPAAQKEIGLTTARLELVTRPVEVEAYGFILDPGPLSRLNSDLVGAQGALDASSAQYLRSKRLYAERKNVSLRDLQSAQASYLADRSRRDAVQQELHDEWGEEIARMDPADRSEFVNALVDRRQAIARVTVPFGNTLDDAPAKAEVVAIGREDHPLATRGIYYAPIIDPKMQGQSFLLRMNADGFRLLPGAAVSAALPLSDRGERGVVVPRSAVVRDAGTVWIYEALTSAKFARREIHPAQILTGGYFITENLRPGVRVVITGAQALLSEEQKQQIQPSD